MPEAETEEVLVTDGDFVYLDQWNEEEQSFEMNTDIIAWQPLPDPYQPNICNDTDCPYNDKKECPASEGCAGYESEDKSI